MYEKLKAPELLSTAHPVLFLNLLYKAMKADRDDARVAAFAKRLLSFGATQGSPALTAGILFLLSEVIKSQPSLREALMRRASVDEGEEDTFDPSKREPSFAFGEDVLEMVEDEMEESEQPQQQQQQQQQQQGRRKKKGQAHLWEVPMLQLHFHPSVKHFASSLLSSEARHRIAYAGDPLQDFSIMAFLDRFAYKNPKMGTRKTAPGEGEGPTEEEEEVRRSRLGAGAGAARHAAVAAAAEGGLEGRRPVNTAEFLSLDAHELKPDQLFFHKFFKAKAERDRKAHAAGIGKNAGSDDDAGSDSEDEDDEAEEEGEEEEEGGRRARMKVGVTRRRGRSMNLRMAWQRS